MNGERTRLLLTTYLDAIGITGYELHVAEDTSGLLLIVEIPKENGERIGILKGRNGHNLSLLKSILNIVGKLEETTPCLVIKLTT